MRPVVSSVTAVYLYVAALGHEEAAVGAAVDLNSFGPASPVPGLLDTVEEEC